MKKNTLILSLLALQTLVMIGYSFVAMRSGENLFEIFFRSMLNGDWAGQFNVDFLCYLILSGIWIMWRGNFRPLSIAIGSVASILGMVFFAPYLMWLTYIHRGDWQKILMGERL